MGDKIKVQELDSNTQEKLTSLFKGHSDSFARFGDVGYLLSINYKDDADDIRHMTVRSDDVWVTTFPRSENRSHICAYLTGTTWTQELVWMLKNDLDYVTASKIHLVDRFKFIEGNRLGNSDLQKKTSKKVPHREAIANAPSPRFIKTHLPFSLLPSNLLDTAKIVYVARDPRDVAVSFYHFDRLLLNYVGDFKTYWDLFINNLVRYAPFFPHLKEAWALRGHPNMLFIFYEDMLKDLSSSIKRIAKFLGKEVTNEQIAKLCEHLDIDNFRKNESVNPSILAQVGNPDAEGFIRKGKSGGWREYFDEEMAAQAQTWMRENLAGSDLRFPDAMLELAAV